MIDIQLWLTILNAVGAVYTTAHMEVVSIIYGLMVDNPDIQFSDDTIVEIYTKEIYKIDGSK